MRGNQLLEQEVFKKQGNRNKLSSLSFKRSHQEAVLSSVQLVFRHYLETDANGEVTKFTDDISCSSEKKPKPRCGEHRELHQYQMPVKTAKNNISTYIYTHKHKAMHTRKTLQIPCYQSRLQF